MGVTSLWQILEPVKQHVPLSSLRGKRLAVDLSLWVCEAQTVKKMVGVVTKPHLRNLYFRVSSLTLMGVHLVFIMEGDPPKLKANTMHKRTEIRFGLPKKSGARRTGRSHFKSLLKECLEMLECLGVPWLQAAGEAEAMCAYLNANGFVDGCITNDGDAFLYGAQTVYRNFTMNAKDPHVDCYSISAIEETLGCSRESLIGLAILLGCDYLPKGVPGVGKEQALKLIRTLRGESLLQRFDHWKNQFQYDDIPATAVKKVIHCAVCRHPGSRKDHERTGCQLCKSVGYCEPHDAEYCCPCDWHTSEQNRQANSVEDSIRKKAKACEGFPFPEVIQEYIISKDKQMKLNACQRPNLLSFQKFAFEKMDWTKHYACEKLCALLTYYDMNKRKSGHTSPQDLQALRIIRTRTKNGIPCFEIEWQKPEHYTTEADQPMESFLITVEDSELFQAAYPEIVALYQMKKLEICKRKKKGKKTELKESECSAEDKEVADLFSRLNLQSAHETFPDHEPKFGFEMVSNCQMLPKNVSKSQDPFAAINLSSTVLQNQNPPDSLLVTASQNPGNECHSGSSLGPQAECMKQNTDCCDSSVIADLQLSGLDWEGTSFSFSPMHVNVACLESDLGTSSISTRQHSPLFYKTAERPYLDSVQCDKDPPRSATCFVSNDDFPKRQHHLHLKDQAVLKLSASEAFSKFQSVSLGKPLQVAKQMKRTSSPEGEFSSPSAQLNDSTLEIENVLSKKYPRGLHLQNSKELKNPENSVQTAQKLVGSGTSESIGLCTVTLEPTCSKNESLKLALKSAKVLSNCQLGTNSAQMILKRPLKKSVCQNRDSSEDSDNENTGRRKPPGGPERERECNLLWRKDMYSNKRSNSELVLHMKQRGKEPNFKAIGTDLSVEKHPRPSSIVSVLTSPSHTAPTLGVSYSHLQENESDSEVWADSPLPLSERLKLRQQSS
ncbi:flap endonuclease GEN homolog 1 [Hemicordylus capensis]|uniref:flap endonuclease GEN homolog 1 n=1 Tax=Hemicordylus capensis TaxID=884348 RepID=UPI002302BB64|nr:flap endonuclease GEN homolog 1 [Hemicordylus capensis]